MPEYWLDSDSLIETSKGPYHPDIVPGFWSLLEKKADEGIIASCLSVYDELQNGEDELRKWASKVNDSGFFLTPDQSVQAAFSEIAEHVEKKYPPHNASQFLGGADPWLIAYAKVHGGRVVTLEKRVDATSKKPKIPNVAEKFGVKTLDIYRLLHELGASFG